MSNLDHIKALLALQPEVALVVGQLNALQAQGAPHAQALMKALPTDKTTLFTLEDGSVKLVSFLPGPQGYQVKIDDAFPEPPEAEEPAAENVATLVPVQ